MFTLSLLESKSNGLRRNSFEIYIDFIKIPAYLPLKDCVPLEDGDPILPTLSKLSAITYQALNLPYSVLIVSYDSVLHGKQEAI